MTEFETEYPPLAGAAVEDDELLRLLGQMWLIRRFEQAIPRLFSTGMIRGTTHLYDGQEAVAVGACSVLRPGDTTTCTYRGHGVVLAMGAPVDACFGEMLGRVGGICRAKGGSMHLTDIGRGALGSFAVVGAHLPITVGAALASQYTDSGAVSVAFFGDGSTNIGAFHEALNLAAVWKLPAIFLCENNLYGEYSPLSATTPVRDLAGRAAAYAMPGVQVDGNDLLAVREVVGEAVARARAGEGPTLVEALTYRHSGHSRSDPATYRPAGELDEWLRRDPIGRVERHLQAVGVPSQAVDEVRGETERVVKDGLDRALAWPEPDPAERFEDVYAR